MFRSIIISCIFICFSFLSFAQSKDAKKSAKQYQKEGYKSEPGEPELAVQIDNSIRLASDDNNLISPGYGKHKDLNFAKKMAIINAQRELAGMISSKVSSEIVQSMTIRNYGNDLIETLEEFVLNAKIKIAQRLGNYDIVVALYRKSDSESEYRVTLSYDMREARRMVNEVVKSELQKEGQIEQGDLDKIFDSN